MSDTCRRFAAIAWHYNKIPNKPEDIKVFLNEVRAFARGPYTDALAQGDNLPEAEVDAIASEAEWVYRAERRIHQGSESAD